MRDAGKADLTAEQTEQLLRAYSSLKALAGDCQVPAVKAAAIAALAQVHTAVNGQGLIYELYSQELSR